MSRFFRGGSDSESDDEIVSSNEEPSDDDDRISDGTSSGDEIQAKTTKGGVKSRFLKDVMSDSEESDLDEKREVKSAKDKRLDALESSVKTIENAKKINDWVAIQNGR